MAILVGCVSQLYQGDHDVGRVAAERLRSHDLGRDVVVEDLHYGAVAVAQLLEELSPEAFVLVGATQRGRAPGSVERKRVRPFEVAHEETQAAVADAVTGYVGVDLVLAVARGFGVLPARTVVFEIEPARLEPCEELSPEAKTALEDVVDRVRVEARRAPLFLSVERVRALHQEQPLDGSPAARALERLLDALDAADQTGRWGAAFTLRERLRDKIAMGETGERMSHLHWALWWALIEELERLQTLEAQGA